jgi:WD40 repeat protein
MNPSSFLPLFLSKLPRRGLGGWRFILLLCLLTLLRGLGGFGYAQKPAELDSLLLLVVKANNLTEVQKLVKQGANVNSEFVGYERSGKKYKAPLLMFAGAYSNLEMIKYLIGQKASYQKRGLLNIKEKNVIYGSLLALVAGENKTDILKYLLEELQIHIEEKELDIDGGEGWNALQTACFTGSVESVKYLLEKGTNSNAQDNQGDTPLSLVFRQYQTQATLQKNEIILLLEKFKAKDKDGNTPLHITSSNNQINIAKILLAKGAKVDVENSAGKTPIQIAQYLKYGELYALLLGEKSYKTFLKTDPLWNAIRQGNRKKAKDALKSGADTTYRNFIGQNTSDLLKDLHYASWQDFLDSKPSYIAKSMVQIGHTNTISQILLLPNNKTFLTSSWDGTVKYWDLVSGKEIRTFQGHTGINYKILLLPDNKTFLTYCSDWLDKEISIKHWDLASGKEIHTFKGHTSSINQILLLPDNKTFLSVSKDKTIKHWDLVSGKEIHTFKGHTSSINQIFLLPDNKTFLTGSEDKTIKHWDLASGKEIHTFKGHTGTVYEILLLPDNKTFLTGSGGIAETKYWNLVSGEEIRSFQGHTGYIYEILLLPDNKTFLTGGEDGTLKHWDLASGEEIRSFQGHTGSVYEILLLPDNKTFLTGGGEGTIKHWDLASGKEIRSFQGHTGTVYEILLLPDDKTFLTGSEDKTIKHWDLASGKEIRSFQGQTSSISEILFLPDKQAFLTGSKDGTVKHWDLASGKGIRALQAHTSGISKILFLPDNKTFLTGSWDGAIKYWDWASNKEIRSFIGHTEYISEILLLPDNKTFLTGSNDKTAKHWDLASGKEIRSFEGNSFEITQIYLFADNQSFLTGAGGIAETKYWNLVSGEEIRSFARQRYPTLLPDKKTFLASSLYSNNTITYWDLISGKEIRRFKGYTVPTSKFLILPNNQSFLTSSVYGDNTIKYWDLASGKEIRTFEGHTGAVDEILLLPDNKTFLTASADNTVKHWDLTLGRELGTFYSRFGGIKSIHYLLDSNRFITINEQNSLTLWDIESYKEIVTLIPIAGDNQDYVLVSPDGRFDGTPEGMKKLLHFVVGNEVVELEQLKDRYYEPGLWKKLLGYSTEPLRNIQDIKDKGLDLYPETILKLNENKLTIQLKPRSGGVGKVSLYVGNKRVVEDINPERKTDFTIDLKQYNKFFSVGQADTLGVVAYEREGTLPSRPETIEYEADLDIDFESMEKEKKRQPHFYGVFIGTSNYQDGSGLRDLAYPVKDAQDLSKAMQLAAQNLLIEPQNVHITLLSTDDKNNLPSKANIRKTLESLAQSKDIRREDVLVVYFSGHGVSYTVDNKDQFFYITQDLSSKVLDDKVVREAFTISTEEIAQWMVNVVARKQVLILDACASGKAVEQAQELLAKKEVPTSQKRALELLKDRTGIFVISGSTSDASSYEASPYGQGFLTYALLSGITGGALQNGEYVDVMSLFQYAANRVPEIAQEFGVIQQPQIATPSKVNSFPIGRVGEKEKKAIQIAQPKPFFVRSSFFNPEENEDNLNLADLLNQSIRENMGAGKSASAIFFDVNNHPQGYKIIGNYTLNGNTIQVKWQIKNQRSNEKSKEFITEGEKTELPELAERVFKAALLKLGN